MENMQISNPEINITDRAKSHLLELRRMILQKLSSEIDTIPVVTFPIAEGNSENVAEFKYSNHRGGQLVRIGARERKDYTANHIVAVDGFDFGFELTNPLKKISSITIDYEFDLFLVEDVRTWNVNRRVSKGNLTEPRR